MGPLEILQILIFPGFLFLIILAFFYEWIDRKLLARVQNRRGPVNTGPAGILQPLADFLKLLSKEDITPMACERVIFDVTPILYLALPLTALFVIPIAGSTSLVSFQGDLIFVMFLLAIIVITVFLAGWSSMSRFSIIGGVRAMLQMLSYEIPLALAMIGPAMAAGTLSISGIVQWQSSHASWGVWLQPLGFAITVICLLAELEFVPFDIPEADTEIVAGWRTEFSGRKLALFKLGRDFELVLASGLIASLFLGGATQLGIVPPIIMFLAKTIGVILLLSFLRSLFARFRIDQMIGGMWKYLLPIAVLQVLLILLLAGR